MTELVKKFLIGASVVFGASTMGAIPTYAASLTGIQFDTTDIEVFYEDEVVVHEDSDKNKPVHRKVSSSELEVEAINALTDDNPFTNVELAASTEDPTANVGFSGQLGGKDVKVESVTANDWNIFGGQWLADFKKAYMEKGISESVANAIGMGIKTMGATRFGDPNVGGFTFDEKTGEYQLDLIGHYNVLDADYLKDDPRATALRMMLGTNPLQVSEIAKVTIDGVVNYAYGFSATETGYVAVDANENDTSSHTGLYSWTFQGEPIKSVPEPSTMLGLVAVGGLVISQRKSRNKA